jgi:hypothetical protein
MHLGLETSSRSKKKETRHACQKKSLKVPVREDPFMFPSRVPMERNAPSPETMIYPFIYICQESPVKISHEMRGKHRSPFTEPHVEGRPTYSGVRPGSTRGLLTTTLSLPQCHTFFSASPSALAWVDQSPVSQRFVVTLNRLYSPHLLPPPT